MDFQHKDEIIHAKGGLLILKLQRSLTFFRKIIFEYLEMNPFAFFRLLLGTVIWFKNVNKMKYYF